MKKIKSRYKGQIAMLKVQLEAQKRGYAVSLPTTEERYDLILDIKSKLFRTQVKYVNRVHSDSRKSDSSPLSLELSLNTKRGHSTKRKNVYTRSEIDLLLLYIPKIDIILAYPADIFHNKKSIKINLENDKAPLYYKHFIW